MGRGGTFLNLRNYQNGELKCTLGFRSTFPSCFTAHQLYFLCLILGILQMRRHTMLDSCSIKPIRYPADLTLRKMLSSVSLWPPVHPRRVPLSKLTSVLGQIKWAQREGFWDPTLPRKPIRLGPGIDM